jgi:hypothetical protein
MISEEAYVEQTQDSASVGTHMRHLLDRFQCLFNGLPDRTVDYDARKRDTSIETNMAAARFAAVTLKRRLSDLRRQEKQGVGQRVELGVELSVRESVHHASPQVSVSSNLAAGINGLDHPWDPPPGAYGNDWQAVGLRVPQGPWESPIYYHSRARLV